MSAAIEKLPQPAAPAFSDDALALNFTKRYGDRLRYVAVWGKWLEYDGARWAPEPTWKVFDFARIVCRESASACNKDGEAKKLASAATVAAVERLARSDRQHAAGADQWDADQWQLNTPTGTIDLQTGEMRKHDRHDHLTKITAIGPGGGCPLWLEFLRRITDGDDDLIAFMKRMIGYSLTGSTREHALFFGYGTGANGKSVFLNTIAGIMGDYQTTASTDTFTVSHTDRHPTDLASLRGARLVTAIETEEGRRWAESRIKALTGGDPISARFMRQDFFEFTPTFKLVICGNHRPSLRNIDEAIRRRLFLIPFDVTIPPDERDETLPERLKTEWPGILEWAIDGCLDWLEHGLAAPERVRAATDEYLAAEDSFAAWLEEAVDRSDGAHETTGELYQSWTTWATKAGEFVGSQKRFSQIMRDRGFEPKREGGTGRAGFTGVSLIRSDYSDREW